LNSWPFHPTHANTVIDHQRAMQRPSSRNRFDINPNLTAGQDDGVAQQIEQNLFKTQGSPTGHRAPHRQRP
jgi:hypothetical protein